MSLSISIAYIDIFVPEVFKYNIHAHRLILAQVFNIQYSVFNICKLMGRQMAISCFYHPLQLDRGNMPGRVKQAGSELFLQPNHTLDHKMHRKTSRKIKNLLKLRTGSIS